MAEKASTLERTIVCSLCDLNKTTSPPQPNENISAPRVSRGPATLQSLQDREGFLAKSSLGLHQSPSREVVQPGASLSRPSR